MLQHTVRVLSLNLWGQYGQWAARRSVLHDGLRALKPDLIAFQESIKNDTYDQVVDLLGSDYASVHHIGHDADRTGSSIVSRWPFVELREVDLHITPRVDSPVESIGSVTAVEVHIPDSIGPLLFVHYTTSWQWGFERERELRAVAAAQCVEAVVGQRRIHVVLAGDFNAPPDAASMRFWRGRQSLEGMSVCYADAWESVRPDEPGHTFTPRNPLVASGEMPLERGRRIDYILVRCREHGPTLDIVTCMLAFNEPVGGVWASDHFGVVADLALPNRASTNPT